MCDSLCKQFSMHFELTPLVLSSMFFFEPKIAFSVYGSEELPTYCSMDNAGADGAILKISLAVTEAKSREVCTVLVDKWLFLKN